LTYILPFFCQDAVYVFLHEFLLSFAKKITTQKEEEETYFLLSLDAISGLECHSLAFRFLRGVAEPPI
jgi:hypothetical protein